MSVKQKYNYKNVESKNGSFSFHVNAKLNQKITLYCKKYNLNKTHFCHDVLNKAIDEKLAEMMENMDKEELINIVLERLIAK